MGESDKNLPIYTVQQRVEHIEKTLDSLLRTSDQNTFTIEVGTLNNQTIIIASDAKNLRKVIIVTITELDAQLSLMSIPELAEQGKFIIYEALIKAWQEREPLWLLRQGLIALVSLAILVSISKLFNSFLQDFRKQYLQNKGKKESLNLLEYWLLPIVLLGASQSCKLSLIDNS